MDAVKIYKKNYKEKYEIIKEIINCFKMKESKIAVWGAGKKGIAFLEVFDPENMLIDYIYDKDKERIGEILPMGHKIVSYEEKNADVVFVANGFLELEVSHTLKLSGTDVKIINLDSVMLGDLSADEIINNHKPDLTKIRECRICAVTVLYNPEEGVIENVSSYASDLECVYLYDNSEKDCTEIIGRLLKLPNVKYIRKQENEGLSVAFNEVSMIAIAEGFDWMITFDQDSLAVKGMVEKLRRHVCSQACDDKTALVAPVVNQIDNEEEYIQESYCSYFDKIIQSGAMHNLSILKKLGGYDENLFIEFGDYDYSVTCIIEGYKAVIINSAVLMHNRQDENVEKRLLNGSVAYFNKYSPIRYYYQYRNAMYCYKKYTEKYPLFALECMSNMRKIELKAMHDVDSEKKLKAIEKAKEDCIKEKMGKCSEDI